MTDEEKKKLYDDQVALLRQFLKNGNITEAQFQKSYTCLTAKMYPGTDTSDTP